jgi:hypothetical protein
VLDENACFVKVVATFSVTPRCRFASAFANSSLLNLRCVPLPRISFHDTTTHNHTRIHVATTSTTTAPARHMPPSLEVMSVAGAAVHVYYCDHLDVHAAAATIKAFAGDSVECHVNGNVVVARSNQPVEANLLDDLRGDNCVLTPASPVQLGTVMTEVDLRSVMDESGVAVPFVWVEGQVAWARTATDAVAIKQALDDYHAQPTLPTAPEETGACDHAEHYAVFASDKFDQPLPPEAPVKALEALFHNRDALNFDFLGRVTMELRDGSIEFWGQFKTAHGANNFAAQLRSGGTLTRVRFDVVGVVAFQTAKIRVETRRIDAVDDTTAGIRDGEMWPVDERITGDCVMIVGSTQSGKSTTVASAIGRRMKCVKTTLGSTVIEGEHPFAAAGFADEFAEEYAIIKRIRADAPRPHAGTLVPTEGPEHADIVLPPDHFWRARTCVVSTFRTVTRSWSPRRSGSVTRLSSRRRRNWVALRRRTSTGTPSAK